MNDLDRHIDPDTLATYAVDALSPDEVVQIAPHLERCQHCQRELASMRAAVGLLPYGLAPAEPPAGLRERVLSAATTGRRSPGETLVERSNGRSMPSPWTWFRRLAPALGAVIFVSGVLLGRAWPRTDEGNPASQPGAVRVTLSGEGNGVLVLLPQNGYVELTVSDLPPLQPGQVYQLWLLGRPAPISTGTFAGDAEGAGRLALEGVAWSPDYTGVAITIEPLGGSPGPTSDIVAQADL